MTSKKKDNPIDNIKIAVSDLVDRGTQINASKAAMLLGKRLGLNERLVRYAHLEIRNKLNELKFKKTKYKDRLLFVPHCLRHSKECPAEHGDFGLECKKCGRCKICKITELADKYGYKGTFIAHGGSMVYKIMKEHKPKAVLGIACYHEVMMGLDKAAEFGVPAQAVMLARDGCRDTDVNLQELEEKMTLIEK